MKKRMLALFLMLAMLVPLIPAVAADDAVPRPTVEEILNEYHEKAFEEKAAERSGGASAYSRGATNSGKTLEEETVDTLNAAGYEAYNVTSANYETLEEQLQTDFADMGLDPDGSYIITISGDESSPSNNARLVPGTVPSQAPDGGGPTFFTYTYNGKSYSMRYVTVTTAENGFLGSPYFTINLLENYGVIDTWEDLEIPITIVSAIPKFSWAGDVYSLLTPLILNTSPRQTNTLDLQTASSWTVKYTQVYNLATGKWQKRASVEYVKMTYFMGFTYYSSEVNDYVKELFTDRYATVYSELYNDTEKMKENAAWVSEEEGRWFRDAVDFVEYKIGNGETITHFRWDEYSGYEPA